MRSRYVIPRCFDGHPAALVQPSRTMKQRVLVCAVLAACCWLRLLPPCAPASSSAAAAPAPENPGGGGSPQGEQQPQFLRRRIDGLYASIDEASDAAHLAWTFRGLGRAHSQLGELLGSQTRGGGGDDGAAASAAVTAVRKAVAAHNDAVHYFQQAARLEGDSPQGVADPASSQAQTDDAAAAAAARRAFVNAHREVLRRVQEDDGFALGDTLYAFTKRHSGAKSAASQPVSLLRARGGPAGLVFVRPSGGGAKQKIPYTWLRRKQRFEMTIPRLTTAELLHSARLLSGHFPFIVTDALAGWPALRKWQSLDYLDQALPTEWVDFYPQNMVKLGSKPWVMPSPQAMARFKGIEPEDDESGLPRYMQYRLSLEGWRRLEQDLFNDTAAAGTSPESSSASSPSVTSAEATATSGAAQDGSSDVGHRRRYLPPVMWTEADWIGCFGSDAVVDNFYRTNQWNMLLIGEKGTGIFFHHDHLAAASWSAQVVGRKTWVVCPYDQSDVLSMDVDAFDPDYEKVPQFAEALCGRATVAAGELLYYPAYWWHQTKCLDRPTIGITGLMVGIEANRADVGDTEGMVHRKFLRDMQFKCSKCWPADLAECKGDFEGCRKCDDISQKWPGAAPPVAHEMCAALPRCYELWDAHFRDIDFGAAGAADVASAAAENGDGGQGSPPKEL